MILTMTVGELIDALKRIDPSKPVLMGSGGSSVDSVTEKFMRDHSVVVIGCKEVPFNKSPTGIAIRMND